MARGEALSDKRTCQFGGFCGVSSGGWGHFGRGYTIRPVQFHVSCGILRPQYLWFLIKADIILCFYGLFFPQCTLVQSTFVGYSGRQGQVQIQNPCQQKHYFECRDFIHIRRYYPILWSGMPRQGTQLKTPTPMVTQLSQSSRGGGHLARDRGQLVRSHSRSGGQAGWDQACCYAFPSKLDVESSDVVITGIISIYHKDNSMLFDPSSTYTYVSSYFASH